MSNPQFTGACSCGRVTYRLHDTALIVHACHCRMCQRLSGSTNAVNALIEAHKVEQLSGDVTEIEAPTPSGKGQLITRCTTCQTAVWSEYRVMSALCKTSLRFIRAGTLDQPEAFAPDVHIYATDMQPHFTRDGTTPVFGAFYDLKSVWPRASLERLSAARSQTRTVPGRVGDAAPNSQI